MGRKQSKSCKIGKGLKMLSSKHKKALAIMTQAASDGEVARGSLPPTTYQTAGNLTDSERGRHTTQLCTHR